MYNYLHSFICDYIWATVSFFFKHKHIIKKKTNAKGILYPYISF